MKRDGRSAAIVPSAALLVFGCLFIGAASAPGQPADVGAGPARAAGSRWAGPRRPRAQPRRRRLARPRRRPQPGARSSTATASPATTGARWPAASPSTTSTSGRSARAPTCGRRSSRSCTPGRCRPRVGPGPAPAVYDAFGAWLEGSLDRWAADHPNPGRPPIHRLNRLEYENAVRDLLHLEIDAQALLPADDMAFGFDNNAAILTVAPGLLSRYMSAARTVSRLAVGDPAIEADVVRYPVSPLLVQDGRMSDDVPFGSRGGAAVRHHFPPRRRLRAARRAAAEPGSQRAPGDRRPGGRRARRPAARRPLAGRRAGGVAGRGSAGRRPRRALPGPGGNAPGVGFVHGPDEVSGRGRPGPPAVVDVLDGSRLRRADGPRRLRDRGALGGGGRCRLSLGYAQPPPHLRVRAGGRGRRGGLCGAHPRHAGPAGVPPAGDRRRPAGPARVLTGRDGGRETSAPASGAPSRASSSTPSSSSASRSTRPAPRRGPRTA